MHSTAPVPQAPCATAGTLAGHVTEMAGVDCADADRPTTMTRAMAPSNTINSFSPTSRVRAADSRLLHFVSSPLWSCALDGVSWRGQMLIADKGHRSA